VLQNRGSGLDMNVQKAWAMGVTGKGVAVTILDDGIETEHPDLKRNYVCRTGLKHNLACVMGWKGKYVHNI